MLLRTTSGRIWTWAGRSKPAACSNESSAQLNAGPSLQNQRDKQQTMSAPKIGFPLPSKGSDKRPGRKGHCCCRNWFLGHPVGFAYIPFPEVSLVLHERKDTANIRRYLLKLSRVQSRPLHSWINSTKLLYAYLNHFSTSGWTNFRRGWEGRGRLVLAWC